METTMKWSQQRIIARSLSLAFAGTAALTSVPVLAADDVQTVVVTAQSRTQTERDVPITMSVISMEQINTLGANNLAELNGYVPGLVVDDSEPTQPSFSLRGLGPSDFGIGTDAPVGIYVDGVYTGKTGGALMNFNDIERIEVLKGPQGTLFGRNSAAGALSIVTNEPSREKEVAARVVLGKFGRTDGDVLFNTPINDTTALRFTAVRADSDGWVKNSFDGKDYFGKDDWGTRLALKWSPNAKTKVVFSWEHEELDQTGRGTFGLIRVPSGTRPPFPPSPAGSPFVDPRGKNIDIDAPNWETRTFDGATLKIETPLAGMNFQSLSAYRTFKSENVTDNDGTSNFRTYLSTVDIKDESTFQQEFKLSAQCATIDWVAGVSYYDADAKQTLGADGTLASLDTLFVNTPAIQAAVGAGLLPAADLFNTFIQGAGLPAGALDRSLWHERVYFGVKTQSVSAFGDVIWHVTPMTNLTGGLRYTRDKKKVTWRVPAAYSDGTAADPLILGVGNAIATGVLGAATTNIIFGDAASVAATQVGTSHSWSDLSPRLVLDHKLSKDTMLFTSLSKGYQAGGYNFNVPNPTDNAAGRFEPEKMTNFEAGFKTYLRDIKLSLNASFFAYKFKNLQEIGLVPGVVPTYSVVVSDQEAKGIDFDARWKVSQTVTLFGGGEYIDLKFTNGSFNHPLTGATLSLNGQPTGTPKLTVMGGATVKWPAFGGYAETTLQATHSGKTRCNAKHLAEYACMPGVAFDPGQAETKVDFKLGWANQDHRYGVALIVNNMLNKQHLSYGGGGQSAFVFGTPYANHLNPPRFVGVELKYAL
jgi:iron complex outermembrane recepter protein